MAKELWNNPIDKNVDWGGDESTNGLPVSGAMIQRFIKESLDGKAGVFYYDTANNRYVVFADEATRNEYLDDPTKTDLILGAFDAPFNYMAEIHLATPTYNAVYLGATGNYLDFTFDVKNKQGASTGENVVITYTFIRNATKQVFSQVARPGEAIHFNIDKYLKEGTNTVIIGVTGQTTLAATTISVTYQVVNLTLTDETDIATAYDLSDGPKTLEVPFSVSGVGTKIVEWYLDGVQLDFVKNEDEVVEVEAQRVKYITLSGLQQGTHSLQIRAYTTINGERFYTPTLYRDVIVYTGVNSDTIIAVAMEIPAKYGLAGNTPTLYGITQYSPYVLRFATYSPSNKENVPVTVAMNEEVLGSVGSKNGIVNEFAIVSKTAGSKTITLTEDAGKVYTIPAVVDATTMTIEEITAGLKLDFSALGRSNNSTDKDSWSFGSYKGTFSGFNWNASSGWADNRLKINNGATFSIDYAPLASNPTSLGRTIELEFKTTNVNDDNAVICDLRNASGGGLLVTATKITLTSEAGIVIENEFKANENVRLGIVIHRSAGTTRKGLSFIYANGAVSRCVNWESADDYESDTQIAFVGSAGAEVELKSIRIYEAALTDDNMLNNYILYRDTVAEMQEVYDRNNVYIEGTTTFSPDKMVSRLPVMLVTGNIPTLENTSDKDTQIIVDIEYTNMQDPSRSFKMVGAAMRPQGTSSMGYPKKNFRIYTQKVSDTILYDANGKVVQDKLYSFKEGAIPVDCWCLKADYAESSGTHNTGIARMWNKALFDMQIDGEYVCRTDAQKAALSEGYPYDVRTTIDGFPILMFYRKNANDEPIFIGKYNFNNDKSTETVFGFKDVPGFNNERMQCWEILNNGNPLALFQTIDGFDSGWAEAYESRYPDTKTPNTADLKAFSEWMVGVNGDHTRFATEKWEHFKVYPMAAYYCYLMRHAAADQLVKNAMLTSEDGQHFYFILYDNDTINGLNNIGEIDLLPTDDRNSVDESGQYKFAGHSSVLWNMLEADGEFMQIVKAVDDALYSAGISYNECIRMFDEEQAEKWVERVYNQDSEYKYVGPFVNNGINNLEMLQGRRDLHRRWWLSKRYSIYDAKFVSGEYKSQAIELKCQNDTPAGQSFSIKAGYPLDYGYGINDVPRETGVTLAPGESHTFTTAETVNLGDPIRIYGSPNIQELDLSAMANRLSTISVANVYTEALGTRLEKLIIGGEGVNNLEVSEISGLKMAKKLTHLNIQGMRGLKSLDLTSQPYFEELYAGGSEIASVSFAKGAPVSHLELPATMKSLNLEQLPYLTTDGLVLIGLAGIHTINVKGCPNLANSFDWVMDWYNTKSTVDSKCSLVMDNVNWTGADADDLIKVSRIGTLDLKGKVVLESITVDQINALIAVFGESAFNRKSDFYIDAPQSIFISGRTELTAGDSERYTAIVFGNEVEKIEWLITSGSNSYVTLDAETGLLEIAEGFGSGTIGLRVYIYTPDEGRKQANATITVKARIYPQQSTTSIEGKDTLENEYQTYKLKYADNVNGVVSASWSLTGLEGYAIIDSYDDSSCVIRMLNAAATAVIGTLTCSLTKKSGEALFDVTKSIECVNPLIAETDPGICAALYNAGLIADETFVTKEEARTMTSDGWGISNSKSIFSDYGQSIKSFDGFKYFEKVTYLPEMCFNNTRLESIEFPPGLTELRSGCFRQCRVKSIKIPSGVLRLPDLCFAQTAELEQVELPDTIYSIGERCFYGCSNLQEINIPSALQIIGKEGFYACTSLGDIELPSSLNSLGEYCFNGCRSLTSISIPSAVTSIGRSCFQDCTSLASVNLSSGVTTLPYYCFASCNSLKTIVLPHSLTTLKLGCFMASGLESIELPDSIVSLESDCFRNCASLAYVKLPSNMTKLAGSMFYNCRGLNSIELPSTLTEIGAGCFTECLNLSTIICHANAAPSVSNSSFGNSSSYYTGRNTYNKGTNMLYVPSGASGYDTSYWLDPLCNADKCGFTLSATL